MDEFELVGEERTNLGSGATRRLRGEGKVPAILYGGESEPLPFTVHRNDVRKHLENEAFLSHILSVRVGSHQSQAVLKAVQRDPISSEITHMDLQRVSASKDIQMHVPLHFMNEDACPGVKMGGIITHLLLEVEVRCLPRNLPQYIEVDVGPFNIGETVHLSELRLPEGVELTALRHAEGEEHDQALVSIQLPRTVEEVEEAEAEEEEAEFDEEITKLVEAGGEEPAPTEEDDQKS